MQETGLRNGAYGADKFGFKDLAAVHWNLDAPVLYEHAVAAREGSIVQGGPFCAETGHHTGRSPKDKHTVVDATTENVVWWDGNRKQTTQQFENLLRRLPARMRAARNCSRRTSMAAPIRSIASRCASSPNYAWHSLFIRQLLIRPVRARA